MMSFLSTRSGLRRDDFEGGRGRDVFRSTNSLVMLCGEHCVTDCWCFWLGFTSISSWPVSCLLGLTLVNCCTSFICFGAVFLFTGVALPLERMLRLLLLSTSKTPSLPLLMISILTYPAADDFDLL